MEMLESSGILRDGKSLILAYDHGLEHGPSDFDPAPRSRDPSHVFELANHDAVTALAVQKGLAEKYGDTTDTNLLVKLNGTSDLWSPDDYYSPQNCSVEYAVEELGADAVGYTMYAGSDHEARMFEDFRQVQEEAHRRGVPVVMWAYPRGNGIRENPEYSGDTDPEVISYAARIALELGADMAKVKYPGGRSEMKAVVQNAAETDVVMSGGSKSSEHEFLESVESVIEAGGSGLAVGRNVFQREQPCDILDHLGEVIHREKSASEVL